MTQELFFIFNLFILGFSAIASLFFILKGRSNVLLAILVPIIVICCMNAYNNVNSLLGYSRYGYLPDGEVTVLALVEEKDKFIHIWYIDTDTNQPRAMKLLATEENKRKARQIGEKLRLGQGAFAEFKQGKGKGGLNPFATKDTEIIIYDFSTRFQSRKQQ